MQTNPELTPLLVVRGARRAIDFYVRALGARILSRYEHGAERHLSHADLAIGEARFALTEEARAWNSDAPLSLGGSPVVLQLVVPDADATLASMREAGATIVFPAQEIFGERMARVRDPFGHLWILRQPLLELSTEELQRQRDELFARFAPEAAGKDESTLTKNSGRVHLIIGPVGAGKSTYALELAREPVAVRLTLDEWMTALFSPERPDEAVKAWYVERARRCVDRIWEVAREVARSGTDVILEIGLLRRDYRQAFYRRVEQAGLDLSIHIIDAARDVRRARVEQRNRTRGATFSVLVPRAVFELASDLWEPPDAAECEGRDVRFVHTDLAAPHDGAQGTGPLSPRRR